MIGLKHVISPFAIDYVTFASGDAEDIHDWVTGTAMEFHSPPVLQLPNLRKNLRL